MIDNKGKVVRQRCSIVSDERGLSYLFGLGVRQCKHHFETELLGQTSDDLQIPKVEIGCYVLRQ